MFVLTQGFPALRRSPHPPQCAHWGTFPRGKAWDVGSESFRHGLRSRWLLCCLTDAAYPLRALRCFRSSECQKGFIDR